MEIVVYNEHVCSFQNPCTDNRTKCRVVKLRLPLFKVKVGNDQEMSQSEKNSHSKNRCGKQTELTKTKRKPSEQLFTTEADRGHFTVKLLCFFTLLQNFHFCKIFTSTFYCTSDFFALLCFIVLLCFFTLL